MFHQTKSQQKQIRFGFLGKWSSMTWPERWEKHILSNQKSLIFLVGWATAKLEDSCEEHETFLRDESYRRSVGFHVATRGAWCRGGWNPKPANLHKKVWGWYTYHTVCDIRIYIYNYFFVMPIFFPHENNHPGSPMRKRLPKSLKNNPYLYFVLFGTVRPCFWVYTLEN